jgi:hypothetical protein
VDQDDFVFTDLSESFSAAVRLRGGLIAPLFHRFLDVCRMAHSSVVWAAGFSGEQPLKETGKEQ